MYLKFLLTLALQWTPFVLDKNWTVDYRIINRNTRTLEMRFVPNNLETKNLITEILKEESVVKYDKYKFSVLRYELSPNRDLIKPIYYAASDGKDLIYKFSYPAKWVQIEELEMLEGAVCKNNCGKL